MMKRLRQKKGFSLVEMLLTLMVVTGLLMAVFQLLEEYVEKELAVATADYMENIALAVQDIVEEPNHFQEVYNMVNARPGDVMELSLNQLVTGFGNIPASTRLNNMVRDRNPMGVRVSILLRVADDPSNVNDTQALDILVATNELIIDERLRRAATVAGGHGGMIRDGSNSIRNAFASWSIPINRFAGTTWANAVTATPSSTDEGGYLAHYRHVSFEDVTGDYMFRVSVPNRPDLNRMYTHLDMGSNNIMGTDNLNLSENMTLTGQAIVNGNVRVGGATRVEAGDVYANNRFIANSATVRGVGGGETGNLTVDDSVVINRLNLTGQLNAVKATFDQGLNSSGQVDTVNLHLQSGIGSAGRIQASQLYGSGGGQTANIVSGGKVSSAHLMTNSLTVSAGQIGTESIAVRGAAQLPATVNAKTIAVRSVNVNTFGECDRGC